MKFIVDMPLSPVLAKWLRSAGHDAVHAQEVRMSQSADVEILAFAESESRVILTADLDFPRLLASIGNSGPGLILLRNGNYSEAESLDCVRRVLMAVSEADLAQSIVVVDKERIRRRPLPIE